MAMTPELAQAAFDAWQQARGNTFEAWSFETDPANLQPTVRRLNREVADFLREHHPPDVEQDRLQRCLDAIEAPWSRREENQLRAVWREGFDSPQERSRALVEETEKIGLEPFHAPEPLPPIEAEDIHLICWMAIQREAGMPDDH